MRPQQALRIKPDYVEAHYNLVSSWPNCTDSTRPWPASTPADPPISRRLSVRSSLQQRLRMEI